MDKLSPPERREFIKQRIQRESERFMVLATTLIATCRAIRIAMLVGLIASAVAIATAASVCDCIERKDAFFIVVIIASMFTLWLFAYACLLMLSRMADGLMLLSDQRASADTTTLIAWEDECSMSTHSVNKTNSGPTSS